MISVDGISSAEPQSPGADQAAHDAAYDAYREAWYQLAVDKDVMLLDLGDVLTDFPTADAAVFYGDTIHYNDLGAQVVADAVHNALFVLT